MDSRYNTGTVGIARMSQSVVKTYHNNESNVIVSPDLINEASILSHLNYRNAKYVPRLYDVNSTSIVTSFNGRPISSIISGMNTNEKCQFFITYMDRIIESVEELHLNGISHNDLKMSNILIDDKDNVIIIDFDQSNFIDVNDISLLLNHYNSPEYHTYESNSRSVDWWLLGTFILNQCLGYEYIPVIGREWDDIFDITSVKYSSLDEFITLNGEGKLVGGVIIPPSIPNRLASYLNDMIQFNPLDRMVNLTRSVPVVQSEVEYDYPIQPFYATIIRYVAKILEPTRPESWKIGVILDIVRRLTRLAIIDHMSIDVTLAIVGMIDTNMLLVNSLIEDYNRDPELTRSIQEGMLNALEWRVMTVTNARLISGGIKVVLSKLYELLDSDESYKLFTLSDRQLSDYF